MWERLQPRILIHSRLKPLPQTPPTNLSRKLPRLTATRMGRGLFTVSLDFSFENIFPPASQLIRFVFGNPELPALDAFVN